MVRAVDNEAGTKWTTTIGDSGAGYFSVGYTVTQVRRHSHSPTM